MKTLKKLITLTAVLGCLSACTYYNTKPGPKENVIGTYELVKYEMNKVDADGNEITKEDGSYVRYDRKAEIGAVAYFSIAEDGYAFYAYIFFAQRYFNFTEQANISHRKSWYIRFASFDFKKV